MLAITDISGNNANIATELITKILEGVKPKEIDLLNKGFKDGKKSSNKKKAEARGIISNGKYYFEKGTHPRNCW